MTTRRARVFEYTVRTDAGWTSRSDRGGPDLPREQAWTPEHLLLAALARCTLTSLEHHAKRSGVSVTATADAHGTVTRREEDGRFAFVSTSVSLDVSTAPRLALEAQRELLARAERDCFVGASLAAKPSYTWTVDGKEV